MLVPMAKVEIIGPKSLFLDVISVLHEQGRLHIEDLSKKIQSGELPLERMEIDGEEVRVYDELDEMLIRVRAILKTLTKPAGGLDPAKRTMEYERLWALTPDALVEELKSTIEEVEDKTADLAALHTSTESELALLARYEPILGKIQPLAKQVVVTGAFDSVALLVERRYKAGLEHLQAELEKLTNSQCEIISTDIDDETTAAIVVYSRQSADAVHKFLAMENVNQIRLPQDFQDMPMDVAYEEIRRRKAELPAELAKIREQLDEMSRQWYLKLSTARDVLMDRVEEIVSIPKFGRTDYAFMIEGWIPVDDVAEMKKLLVSRFGEDIVVNQTKIDQKEYDQTPVAMKNAGWAEPFQTLLGFMGTPKYGTYDPTWMLGVFYPLFFGMIVGDIGYGLIMMGTLLWLRRKYRENNGVQLASRILGPAITMVIVFGFLYGEFFGNLLGPVYMNLVQPLWTLNGQIHIGLPVPPGAVQVLPFVRTNLVIVFLLFAILVGLIQVLLGLVLGVYNGIRTKHISHVYEKGGILAFVVGFLVLLLASIFMIEGATKPIIQAIGGLALFLGLFFAIKGGGVIGAIESVGALNNIASYSRIMAVGLAGAIFADATNAIAQKMGNPVLGIIIAVPLQMLNLVIAAFSPSIHAIRLNFLEFFNKFYETGQTAYKPFHKTRGEKNA